MFDKISVCILDEIANQFEQPGDRKSIKRIAVGLFISYVGKRWLTVAIDEANG